MFSIGRFGRSAPVTETQLAAPVIDCSRFTRRAHLSNAQITKADFEWENGVSINGIQSGSRLVFKVGFRKLGGENLRDFVLRPESFYFADSLEKLMNFFGVRALSRLNGRLTRVVIDEQLDSVLAFSELLGDRWLVASADGHGLDLMTAKVPSSIWKSLFGKLREFPLQVFSPGYENAKIKVATLSPPGKDGNLSVFVKVVTENGQEESFKFLPRNMDELGKLIERLGAIAGSANFERLHGRFVRVMRPSWPDLSTSSGDRALAARFCLAHPMQEIFVGSSEFRGHKVRTEEEKISA